jgi:hypothetical protein
VGTPSAGAPKHIVAVLATPANLSFNIGPAGTISHLAVYQQAMTAGDVANLYATNVNGIPTIVVTDTGTITVTEPAAPVDIYAYSWSIVSGGSS